MLPSVESLPNYSLCYFGQEAPREDRHGAKWDLLLQHIREGWSGREGFDGGEHLSEFHLRDITGQEEHFDTIETTVSHLFREPCEALQGLTYGRMLAKQLRNLGWWSPKPRVIVEVGGGLGYVARDLAAELSPIERQGIYYVGLDLTRPFLTSQLKLSREGSCRVELTKTLYSELGNGDPHQAHITLLNNFARTLGLDEPALDGTVPIMGVRAYLDRLHHLFLESDYLTALGAEMAVEITAASEFRYLYPGLKAYATFRDEDLRFFRLHLEEEVCHGTWLTDAVQRTAESTRDFDVVASGARRAADAWHRFWVALYHHVFEPGENGRDAPVTRPPERPNGTGEQS